MEENSLEQDLRLTVQELSNAYEEISLLHRISGIFSTLSVEEICARMLDETVATVGVRTAAVLLMDDRGTRLSTKTFRGNWDSGREFEKDGKVIWKAIEARRPSAFCRLAETEHFGYIPGIASLLVCPLSGKKRMMGAIIAADKEDGGEFFAKELKLLSTIASQAGLAIENAFLHSELEDLLLGAIRSLVKALEASSRWTAGHTERVTSYALDIAGVLGLDGDTLDRLRICALLHDIGKIATPRSILDKSGDLDESEWEEMRRHPVVAEEILSGTKQFGEVILGIKYHHEYWDGSGGTFGLRGQDIPLMSRIISVADAFDALTSDRPYRLRKTEEEATRLIKEKAGTQFDPAVVDAFLAWAAATPRRQASGP